jgi:hypothetical protein
MDLFLEDWIPGIFVEVETEHSQKHIIWVVHV